MVGQVDSMGQLCAIVPFSSLCSWMRGTIPTTNFHMPDEIITLYTKESPADPVSCERSAYYDNAFTTYKDHYPALIDVFLFNKHSDVLLQKRGRNKRFNAGKLNTTVGGHINWGEQAKFSVIHECMEELGAPALAFPKDAYNQAFAKLQPYTHKAALLCEIKNFYRDFANDPIESRRTIKDRIWLYFGRYDGPIEIPDRDSAGYEWISLDALQKEFQQHPEQFTDGLKAFTETFGDEMENFVRTFCQNQPASL